MAIKTTVECDYRGRYGDRCYAAAVTPAQAEIDQWFAIAVEGDGIRVGHYDSRLLLGASSLIACPLHGADVAKQAVDTLRIVASGDGEEKGESKE